MGYPLDTAKYANVPADLRDALFGFAARVERKQVSLGRHTWEYLDVPPIDRPTPEEAGPEEPVVFFAGGAKLAIYSFAVIDALSQHHRVLAISQPGCNTLDEHFGGVTVILERESIRRFHVAGSSWGGCVAQAAAIRYPERVAKTVLASTGLAGGRAVSVMLKLYLASIRRGNPAKAVADFRQRALGLLIGDPATDALWTALFSDIYDRHMTHAEYVSLISTQLDYVDKYAPAIARAKWPGSVLIVTTADETAGNQGWREALLRAYPAAEFRLLEHGGHHPALLARDDFRQAIDEFLSRGR